MVGGHGGGEPGRVQGGRRREESLLWRGGRMHRGYSTYGWRARIGLVLHSLNVTMEPEMARLMPAGVSVHTARVMTRGMTTPDSYREMAGDVERAAEVLETADVDIVAYACTSGSIVEDEEPILERIRQIV